MSDKRFYFVFRAKKDGDTPFDTHSGTFSTLEEAAEAAEAEWGHMTSQERRKETVTVGHIESAGDQEQALEQALSEGFFCDLTLE